MTKLPRVSGPQMVKFLQQHGFVLVRIRGSHHYFKLGSRHTTVPVHGKHSLKIGTLRSILRDIDVAPGAFARFLRGR